MTVEKLADLVEGRPPVPAKDVVGERPVPDRPVPTADVTARGVKTAYGYGGFDVLASVEVE